jgi:hypothetical protein
VPSEVIYVELLDEAVSVWRPVEAERVRDGVFLLPDAAPDDEEWAFKPGSRVRCEAQDIGLVAVAASG